MDISINGTPADITLESEKTVGEILAGFDHWLTGSGHRLSGLQINGEIIDSNGIAESFGRELKDIQTLNIKVSAWPELAAEALADAQQELTVYESASFERRRRIWEAWEGSAGAHFFAEQFPDIFHIIAGAFNGEGLAPGEVHNLIDERLRELAEPVNELKHIEALVAGVAVRLEDLPLDIQTGKDARAVETIQLFSHVAEKIFRLYTIMTVRGFIREDMLIDSLPIHDFIAEFGAALKELAAAYEMTDAVLVGDLAEYELAPHTKKLFAALIENTAAFLENI
jgi:hypothetical protein